MSWMRKKSPDRERNSPAADEKKLAIAGHLVELRSRLLKSVIAAGVCIGASFAFVPYVFDFLKSRAPNVELIYITPTGMLGTYMKVAIYCGLALALPILIYELLMFLSPALKRNEKRYIYRSLPAVVIFFIAGVAFSYFVLLPPALGFLQRFNLGITPLWTVDKYVSLVVQLLFWVGLVFELPFLMFLLSKLGVVTPQWLANKRKYNLIFAFILGAAITPTFDPVNQCLVALPIILLFEIGILLAKLARRGEVPLVPAEAEATE